MFLRHTKRWKDGKEHYYWSLVENRRCGRHRIVQHTLLYLGEINDSQKEQWIRAIEVFDEDRGQADQLKLFAAERPLPVCVFKPDRILTSQISVVSLSAFNGKRTSSGSRFPVRISLKEPIKAPSHYKEPYESTPDRLSESRRISAR